MTQQRTYPDGVPSWIDCEQPDLDAAQAFYGGLFGWTFEVATPADAPSPYVIARRDDRDVAGLSTGDAGWSTYVAVDDADDAATRVVAAGGELVAGPTEAGEGGRAATCADPSGTTFRLWQARRRLGAQAVNEPGTWNFSDLHTDDPDPAVAFYREVFGWVFDDLGFATMIRRPGYGQHLASTIDPDILARQADAPPGFADAIAWLGPAEEGTDAHWHVSFTVADRDESAALAESLGAVVLSSEDTQWTRTALLRDPQGAVFTASQFTPPDDATSFG